MLLFRRFLATLSGENLFPAIRLVTLAGDVVMPADVEAWKRHFGPTCVLMHRFSATETGMLCVTRIESGTVSHPFVIPPARAVADKHIEVVDESGQPVLPGEAGELLVRSAFIADGYWRPAGQADGAFEPDPQVPGRRVYRTGDLARILPDGGLVFLGRRDRQVKIRGFRVELAEVEAALLLHAAVREVVVVVRELAPADKQLVAYIVPGRDPHPSGPELRSFLEQRLAHYMIPARFEFLDEMPLTPTGKIDRQRLPPVAAPGPADPPAAAHDGAPRNEVERQLVAIWQEVLAVDRVSTQDNFFDLGGHSLLAAQMFTRVEERLRIRLPLATLFQTPTIEGLARAIGENRAAQPWRSLVPIHTEGSRLPVFAVPGIGGNVLCYRELSRLLGPDQPFYGLQSRGLGGTEQPLTDIGSIAAAHLEEVRLVQPAGPYVLVGACLGGVVAYEMAQQLRTAGQEVALLALIEASVPRVNKGGAAGPKLRLPAGLRFVLSRLQLYWETLGKLEGRQRLGYLRERLAVLGQIVTHRDLFRGDRTEFHSRAVAQANVAAFRKYRPRPYPGRLVLYCAGGRQLPADQDRRLSWASLAAGGVESQVSPGDDSGQMLISPHVEVLAPKLAACLAGVQQPRPLHGTAPRPPLAS